MRRFTIAKPYSVSRIRHRRYGVRSDNRRKRRTLRDRVVVGARRLMVVMRDKIYEDGAPVFVSWRRSLLMVVDSATAETPQ